ncbi:MAG: SDR family NAD(P)-dependent oxidoreductase, partial [Rhodococcus sp. (in: high G+C Gram-positive bacteria)]|uniref:SDR family NAD(P)-dependent oxidoreductase n=1 Tax=Rhodococcus sp. TaxID=1831 RepID=UPI003BB15CEE
MDIDLTGKSALVTGGGSGIGAACVRELAACGAKVAVADLSAAAARAVADEIGGGATAITADVSNPGDASRMVTETLDAFGSLDIAVNNAGVGMPTKASVGATDIAEWRRVLSIN